MYKRQGYRYRGLPIGAFIDTDSKFTQISYLREITENQLLKTDLFYAEPNTDAVGRNIWGSPPAGCADYAFQQHIHQSLDSSNGRTAILWPHGILFRENLNLFK